MSDMSSAARKGEDPEEVEAEAGRASAVKEVPEGAEWTAVEEAMLRRRSIRKYKRKQVPAHLIRRLLEVGRYAPSQGNCQPWKFVVIRDADMIQGMEDFCVESCRKLSSGLDYVNYPKGTFKHFVTRAKAKLFGRLQPNMLHPVPVSALTAIAQGRFAVFHRAPTVILPLMDTRGVGTPEIDIGICGTNIVLAAQSLGLGTCWVGFSSFLNKSREWRARLGVEEPYEIVEAITVGYSIGDPTHLISRETHEIAWFEGGRKEILY
jgi:nitroreductase